MATMLSKNKKWVVFGGILLAIFLSQPFISKTKRSTEIFFFEIEHVPNGCEAIQSSDVSSFDWDYIDSDYYFEVCLRELAIMLGTPERMAKWLRSEGFSRVSPYERNDRVYLNAAWVEEDAGRRVPLVDNMSFLYRWYTSDTPYRIQVRYGNDGSISTSANHPVL